MRSLAEHGIVHCEDMLESDGDNHSRNLRRPKSRRAPFDELGDTEASRK